jgi:hypothetical protein
MEKVQIEISERKGDIVTQLKQAQVDEGKVGTKNLQEVVHALVLLAIELKHDLKDGLQPFQDGKSLVKFLLGNDIFREALDKALDDISMIPHEVMDLKVSEIVDLFKFLAEETKKVITE